MPALTLTTPAGVTLDLYPALPTNDEYRLILGHDFGDAQVVTSSLPALLYDGSLVVGRRATNRQMTLPLQVKAPTRLLLAQRVAALLTAADSPSWVLTWTPDAGLPIAWDCFRAQPNVGWDMIEEGAFSQQVDLVFEAQPFGRTPGAALALTRAATATGKWSRTLLTGYLGNARTPLDIRISFGTGAGGIAFLHAPPASADPLIDYVLALTAGVKTIDTTLHPYAGTYNALAVVNALGTGPGTRTYTLLVEQQLNGVTIAQQTFSQKDPTTASSYYISFGPLSMPLIPYVLGSGSAVGYKFTVTDTTGTGTATTFHDVILFDTMGQTVVSLPDQNLHVAPPTPLQAVGPIYTTPVTAGVGNEYAAASTLQSGGPFVLEPNGGPRLDGSVGPAPLIVWSIGTGVSPLRSVTSALYVPRWLSERYA